MISRLKTEVVQPDSPVQQTCFCQEDFKTGDTLHFMPCDHAYHKDCLLNWLKLHNSCPNCRAEIPGESVVSPVESP